MTLVISLFIFLPSLFDIISKIFDKALVSKGGKFESVILLLSPIVVMVWIWLLFVKKNYLKALFFQIIIFPFTYKAAKAFAINIYLMPGYTQQISLTTFLIIALFLVLYVNGLISRSPHKDWRIFEKLLIIFAISLTVSQLINHTLYDSIWLSIGAIWQFVLLFYILTSLVKTKENVYYILNALIIFCFINIFVRIVGEEQALFQSLHAGVIRVGEGAMGPPVSYGGYLAIIITIALALYRCKEKIIYLGIGAILFIELLNTFTRAGFLALFFLLFIPVWKKERKFFSRVLISLMPIIIIFGKNIWEYASFRGLSISSKIMSITNVDNRMRLIRIYLTENFHFSIFGRGIGNPTFISMDGRSFTAHNLLVDIYDTGGIVVMIIFLIIYIYSTISAFNKVKSASIENHDNILFGYVFISLLQWFFFMNITSAGLFGYYPYEATFIFWIISFLPFLKLIQNKKNIAH